MKKPRVYPKLSIRDALTDAAAKAPPAPRVGAAGIRPTTGVHVRDRARERERHRSPDHGIRTAIPAPGDYRWLGPAYQTPTWQTWQTLQRDPAFLAARRARREAEAHLGATKDNRQGRGLPELANA